MCACAGKINITSTEGIIRENKSRWFGHGKCRLISAPIRKINRITWHQ